ncbi:hypothetical protein G3580_04795 [Nitrogeniibacter mangrovi]|uniref:Nucleotidyltransferase n=1 Tax=Nitrogeniibacter mangrovi TaxID=2016596 RepID=A0A6C1B2G9_9RHOO|nr:hypothetical protein [Nitrogeniibacter mangrovi]QID17018.1 hypothetical protein G3580_04795 [Nitrogeniibacter mangrovi]
MPNRAHGFRSGHLRQEVAAAAARMMAEDGISDFGFAKRKAARQLGATDADSLPTNAEIEAALREYQAIYQDEEHDERIYAMRCAAAEVLDMLSPFRAYLTGPVLEGTAGRYAEVDIEVFADSAKDVEIFFLNQDLRYEHREPRKLTHDTPEAILCFDWDDIPVRVTIHESRVERRGGVERARLEAVEKLIADGLPTP